MRCTVYITIALPLSSWNRVQYVTDSKLLTRDSSCTENLMCTWETKSITLSSISPFAPPAPTRRLAVVLCSWVASASFLHCSFRIHPAAEDTQNQHTQRVRTVVDSFLKLLVLRFTAWRAFTHTPRLGSSQSEHGHPSASSDQFWSRIHQEVTINSGRGPITACVTGSI